MGPFRLCIWEGFWMKWRHQQSHWLSDLTTLSKVLREKLIIPLLVKKFAAFCGTLLFINVLTIVRHLSLPCFLKIQFNINLPSSPTSSFLNVSAPKFCMHLCCSPYVPHDPPISFFLTWYQTNNIWWAVQIMKLLTVQSSPFLRSLSLLGPNIVLIEVVREILRIRKILSWVYQSCFNVIWHKSVVWVDAVFVPCFTP
jgi:hypothetical protein